MRPLLATALSVLFLLASLPAGSAASEPQVFFFEPFDDLDGWTFEGDAAADWGLTTDRAHNGTALYLGDDQGTPDPEDNRFDCFGCRGVAVSPDVTLPADGPAFLYFWTFVELDRFPDAGFTTAVRHNGTDAPLGEVPQLKGSLIRFDLSSYAGRTIQLVFDAEQGWPWQEEGVYLDAVLVTDLEVEVSKRLDASGEGPALEAFFTVPERGTNGILDLRQEGRGGDSIGAQFFLFQDGRLVYGGGFWGQSIGPSIDIDLLGEEVVRHNATSGSWGITSMGSLDLGMLTPGDYRLVSVLHGTHTATTTATVYVDQALDGVRIAAGGADLAYTPLSGFTSQVHVAVAEQTLVMVDGHYTREASGRAIGVLEARGSLSETTPTVPGEPEKHSWAYFAEEAGTWGLHVHYLVDGGGFPAFQLVQFAALPDPVDLPASDASSLPRIGDGTAPPAPEPEPEPWPEGYNTTADAAGLIGCSVAYGPIRTADQCRTTDPNAVSRFSFPLDDGLTALDLEVTTEGGPFGEAQVCAHIIRPLLTPQKVCSDEGRVTVWKAPEGEAHTRGNETLEIEVRIAQDQGVLYQQPIAIAVETAHWGGAA